MANGLMRRGMARQKMKDRLQSKIMPVPHCGCWLWVGDCDSLGYGRFYEWTNGRSRVRLAHRVVYEFERGEIPEGLDLDHLCRNPSCVNPDHLEPVTHAVNMARGAHAMKTHCKNGHAFSGENLIRRPDKPKARECRACRDARLDKFHMKNPNYNLRANRRARMECR